MDVAARDPLRRLAGGSCGNRNLMRVPEPHGHGAGLVTPQPRWGWVCVPRRCPRERLPLVADPWAVVRNPSGVGVDVIPNGDVDESPGMRPAGRFPGSRPWQRTEPQRGFRSRPRYPSAAWGAWLRAPKGTPRALGRTERLFDAAPRTTRSHPTPARPSTDRPSRSASSQHLRRNGPPAVRA